MNEDGPVWVLWKIMADRVWDWRLLRMSVGEEVAWAWSQVQEAQEIHLLDVLLLKRLVMVTSLVTFHHIFVLWFVWYLVFFSFIISCYCFSLVVSFVLCLFFCCFFISLFVIFFLLVFLLCRSLSYFILKFQSSSIYCSCEKFLRFVHIA